MKHKKFTNVRSLLRKTGVQKASVFAVAFLVIGSVAYFGTNIRDSSSAATGQATMSLSPANGTYAPNDTIAVKIKINSEVTDPINVVQSSLTYDPNQLSFISITEGTAFPGKDVTSKDTPGLVRIARSTKAPIGGPQDVVTVSFRVLASTGTAAVTIDPGFSYIVRSTDSLNIMTGHSDASYTIKLPTPTLISVNPNTGPAAGGTPITLAGTNFVSGAKVQIGGVQATGVVFNSASSLNAVTPAGTAGPKDVVVTNPDGQTATLVAGFSYAGVPTIIKVEPPTGPAAGGTPITITGTNFATGATVKIGTNNATAVTVVNGTTITATTPAGASGTVNVTVTNLDGSSVTKTGGFTYLAPPPNGTSVSPAVGFPLGGLNVTITGTNFVSGATVTIGGKTATSVTWVNATTLKARTPALPVGLASIVIKNPDSQQVTMANAFKVQTTGDVDGDSRVNAIDLSYMISKDGQVFPQADFDGDGTVGAADLAMLYPAWTW